MYDKEFALQCRTTVECKLFSKNLFQTTRVRLRVVEETVRQATVKLVATS